MPPGRAPEAPAGDDLPDDPITDPAEEQRRRVAFDAAMAAISDDTLAEYVEKLIAICIKAWDLDETFATDMAQEALTRVLDHRRKWDPRRGNLYQFLRGVLHSLADHYFDSAAFKYNVHPQRLPDGSGDHGLETEPEGNVDPYENNPGPVGGSAAYVQNAEQLYIAQETWDQDKADFASVTQRFAKDADAMGVVRASQKNIRDAKDQAEHVQITAIRIYRARRRITTFLRELFEDRDDKPRLARVPVRPPRRAGETPDTQDGDLPSTDSRGPRGPEQQPPAGPPEEEP